MQAAKPLITTLVFLLALTVVGTWLSSRLDAPNALLSMPAETVVEQFLKAGSQGRWDIARDLLTSDLQTHTPPDRLAALFKAIEHHHGEIDRSDAEANERQDAAVTVNAHLAVRGGSRLTAAFDLQVEHGEWRIATLHDLERLTAPSR